MNSRPDNSSEHRESDPARRTSHDQWDELAVGYALTALEPDEMERFIEHLVSFCPQCQQSVDDTANVGAELGLAMPVPIAPPSASLRNSVLSAAFAARPAVPQTSADLGSFASSDDSRGSAPVPTPIAPAPNATTPVSPAVTSASPASAAPVHNGVGAHRVVDLSQRRARRASRSAGWLVAAAAAVVAVVLSVTTAAALHSRSRTAADASAYRQAVLTATESAGQVVPLKDDSGHVVASVFAHSTSVSVFSKGIAPNSKSTSYVLWGISGKTANPVALGVFDVTGTHVQTAQVGDDSRGYGSFKAYAVSVEPGHTAPKSPSHIVANS